MDFPKITDELYSFNALFAPNNPGEVKKESPTIEKEANEMKISTIISVVVATLAIAGIVVAFLGNASPYVTISEAQKGGKGVHVVGILDKPTYKAQMTQGQVVFTLTDETKARLAVVYKGPPVSNMMTADRVVVVGSMEGEIFQANKILVKCPSKYEGQAN